MSISVTERARGNLSAMRERRSALDIYGLKHVKVDDKPGRTTEAIIKPADIDMPRDSWMADVSDIVFSWSHELGGSEIQIAVNQAFFDIPDEALGVSKIIMLGILKNNLSFNELTLKVVNDLKLNSNNQRFDSFINGINNKRLCDISI